MPLDDLLSPFKSSKSRNLSKNYVSSLSDTAYNIGLELGNPYSSGSGYWKVKKYSGKAYGGLF